MIKENTTSKRELGLYIHIPFCVKKCSYCDFLSAAASEEAKKEYVEALIKEIKSYQGRALDYSVSTIFFGGGTPSCIAAEEIARIMEVLRQSFYIDVSGLEASIEVNPGTITREKLITYHNAGINRISFGLQSTDNQELQCLGRIHTFEEFRENYHLARELGFNNINVDLMSALPGQTLASWENTLNTVARLEPEHISAYSLIIEEGTEFYDRYRPGTKGELALPDEETDRNIYYRTKELLEHYGYHRYEVSNYAKTGYECRHNNSYWIGTDYLGLGLGAASLLEGVRFSNRSDIKEYILLCKTAIYSDCRRDYRDKSEGMNKSILKDNTEGVNKSILKDNTEGVNKSILKDNTEGVNKSILMENTEGVNESILKENTEGVNESILMDNAEGVNKSILSDNKGEVNLNIVKDKIGVVDKCILWDNSDKLMDSMLSDVIGLRIDPLVLTKEQQMEEFMFLGLRRCEGVSIQEFKNRFSEDITTIYGEVLEKLEQKKLVEVLEDNIRLTEYGIDISNMVLAEFLF